MGFGHHLTIEQFEEVLEEIKFKEFGSSRLQNDKMP